MGRYIGTICILIILASMLHAGAPVKAAQPDTVPVSDNCVLDSTIGILDVYFCESSNGPDYLVNSFGFVVAVD